MSILDARDTGRQLAHLVASASGGEKTALGKQHGMLRAREELRALQERSLFGALLKNAGLEQRRA